MYNRQLRKHLTRDWIFGISTLLMACVWIEGATQLADHVRTINSARLVGMLLTAGMINSQPESCLPERSLLPGLIPPPQSNPVSSAHEETFKTQQNQIAYVEATVFIWEKAMHGLAGLLVLVGLFSLLGQQGRPLHLLAGVMILLSTAGTLTAMILLMDPQQGGLPPLSIITFILVGVGQSAYGIILLAVFWHRHQLACTIR